MRRFLAFSLPILLFVLSTPVPANAADPVFPGQTWEAADPATAGWSVPGLDKARSYFLEIGSTAVVIVHNGRIVAAWGDTERRVKIASVRKSFLSALYGIAVEKRQVDLDRTIVELQIDDKEPRLTASEKQAKVRDLLKARSGVYHLAAAESPAMKARRPERGSHAPDTFWYYNNWDFNVLGTIFRKATGEDTFAAVEHNLARPLGMEHFTARDGEYSNVRASEHPAYSMKFTARDLARFGWLYLNRGRWGERQVVPAEWVAESTRPWSPNVRPGVAYGYMWWVSMNDRHFGTDVGPGAFSARGQGGQYIVVAPARGIVVVHLNENEKREAGTFNTLLRHIFAAAPK